MRPRRFWRILVLVLALFSSLSPLLWTLLASVSVRYSGSAWRFEPSWDAYRQVQIFESRFVPELLASTTVALMTAGFATTLGLLTAHALERHRFPGRALTVQLMLVHSSLPVLAFLEGLKVTLQWLGLYDTVFGLALAETTLYAPLAAFVLYSGLCSLPANLCDAAQIQGANAWAILWRVIAPSSAQALLATGALVFVLSWNQVLVPLVISTNLKLLPVALVDVFIFERQLEWPTAAAALMVSLVPLWCLVAFAFRWLESFSLSVGPEEH